ncbi:MAG: hypothetical protein ABSC06_03230 [Rhodopila sp.]
MSDVLSVHIAEYTALRAEICAFHNVEGQVMSITVALIGALIGFVTAALAGQISGFKIGDDVMFLHLVPLPFVALGIIFAYTQVRTVQAATYLQKCLRVQVIEVLGPPEKDKVWQWEIFRREGAQYPVRTLAIFLNSVRWIFFIGPSLFPLSAWARHLDSVGAFLILVWDLALPIFLIVLAAWTSVRLPRRVVS